MNLSVLTKNTRFLAVTLAILLFGAGATFAQSPCTSGNWGGAYVLSANDYPYFSAGSGITVNATLGGGVPTLNNFSYTCSGITYNCQSPAWWLNNAGQSITLDFSAPVSSFSVIVNGTNTCEEFYFAVGPGQPDCLQVQGLCTAGWTSINGGTGLLYGGATTSNLIVVSNPPGATQYVLTHNGCGAGSRYALVDCIEPAGVSPTLNIAIDSIMATCGGCDGEATANPSGVPGPYTYSWAPSGGTGATATNLCPGVYTVTVTSGSGCVTNTATVNITGSVGTFTINQSQNDVTCNGGSNGSATANITGGVGPFTYSWAPSGGTGSTESGLAAGSYTVTVTDVGAAGCSSTAIYNITEPTPVVANITGTTPVSCSGGNDGTATASGSGGTGTYTYAWAPSGGTGATTTPLPMGQYTVTVTDNNGCTGTTTADITELPALTVSLTTTDDMLCDGDMTDLTANPAGGTVGYNYSWSHGLPANPNHNVTPTTNTTYTVTVTDANGCTATADLPITVSPLPNMSFTATGVCHGYTTDYTNTSSVSSGSITTYQWDYGDGSPFGTTVDTYHTYGNSGTYNVVLTGYTDMGCYSSIVVPVTVHETPTVNFSADDPNGCVTHCVNFMDNSSVTGSTITSLQWFNNGVSFGGSQTPSLCFNNPGLYTISLVATTSEGCTDTLTMVDYVEAYALPIADFDLSSHYLPLSDPTVEVLDKSLNGVSWDFDMGDGTYYYLNDFSHTYIDIGNYCITLQVTSINGCTDTLTQCIEVYPEPTLYIPNSFTPNGDGLNEIFMAQGIYIDSFEMRIFNRWGEEIHAFNSLDKGWDGTLKNGGLAQQGTYVYRVTATDTNGDDYELMGKVNLIR